MRLFRYYPALKTLEQLEHTYLPRVMTHWFSQTMAEAIPKLRQQIKEASMSELKDFLESIRKHSTKIGEVAMTHVRVVIWAVFPDWVVLFFCHLQAVLSVA